MNTPLLDGISKCSGRSHFSDFVAGIDPTGTKTLQYGVQDVGSSKRKRDIKKTIGVTGGLLAGALLLPSGIMALIKGGKGLIRNKGILNRLRGGIRGLGKGFIKPYGDVYHGLRSTNYLKSIRAGKPIPIKGEASMRKLVNNRFGELFPGMSQRAAGPDMTKKLQWLSKNKPSQFNSLLNVTSGSLGSTLAFMGLGGAVNAGSALAQYNLGQTMGKRVTPGARSELLGNIR